MTTFMTLEELRKNPFAWPGGYPTYGLLDDGSMLCHKCIHEPEVHEGGPADGWRYEYCDVLWEGEVYCGHCSCAIESAYGEAMKEGSGMTARKLEVNVTQDDIDCGSKKSLSHCPIARAIRRVLEGRVSVLSTVARVDDMVCTLPPAATRFVVDFDAGRPVSPITFILLSFEGDAEARKHIIGHLSFLEKEQHTS